MQSISDALESLRADGAWFARATELRLMSVHVAGDLRNTALNVLAMLEFHHDNLSPWVVLQDAHLGSDAGWQLRAHRLLAQWEARRVAFERNEGRMVPAARAQPSDPFEDVARAVLEALPEPMRGLVLILAPGVLEDVEAMGRQIERLLAQPGLEGVRVIWVLDADARAPSLVGRMGEAALASRCQPDPDAQAADVRALVAGSMAGGAGPGVSPPRRVDDPPPLAKAQRDLALEEAGVQPAYLEAAPRLAQLVLGAALAMKEGRGPDAVRQQREARDLSVALDMPELTVTCQVTLATYLSGLGQRPRAIEELDAAVRLAKAHDLALQEVQARLALGLLHATDRRYDKAAREYAESARRAEASQMGLLAIEGWRLAGQMGLSTENEVEAARCFRQAIRVAEWNEPDVVKESSASEAARQLASLCRARGLLPQADSLDEAADKMDAGEIGTPFDEAPTLRRRTV